MHGLAQKIVRQAVKPTAELIAPAGEPLDNLGLGNLVFSSAISGPKKPMKSKPASVLQLLIPVDFVSHLRDVGDVHQRFARCCGFPAWREIHSCSSPTSSAILMVLLRTVRKAAARSFAP